MKKSSVGVSRSVVCRRCLFMNLQTTQCIMFAPYGVTSGQHRCTCSLTSAAHSLSYALTIKKALCDICAIGCSVLMKCSNLSKMCCMTNHRCSSSRSAASLRRAASCRTRAATFFSWWCCNAKQAKQRSKKRDHHIAAFAEHAYIPASFISCACSKRDGSPARNRSSQTVGFLSCLFVVFYRELLCGMLSRTSVAN